MAKVMFLHGKRCTVTALKCNGIAKVCKTLLQSSLLKYYDIIIYLAVQAGDGRQLQAFV